MSLLQRDLVLFKREPGPIIIEKDIHLFGTGNDLIKKSVILQQIDLLWTHLSTPGLTNGF